MTTSTKLNRIIIGGVIVVALSILAGCGESGQPPSSTQSLKPAPIVLISTEPTDLVRGSYAIVKWSATDATECHASGAWSGVRPISGSEIVLPHDAGTMQFTLSCSGMERSTTSSALLIVFRGVSPPRERPSAP